MDFDQLSAFDAVVRLGSFSRAAEHLDLTQPSVSARIQRLEQHLGGSLFRRGRRLELTELGQRFLPYARQALSAMGAGLQMAELTRTRAGGRLTLAVLPALTVGRLARALHRLHLQDPALSVGMHTGHNLQVQEMLKGRFAQLGLLNLPFEVPGFEVLKAFQDPLLLVASPSHPAVVQRRLPARELPELLVPFLRIDWSWDVRNWQIKHLPARPGDLEVPPMLALELLRTGTFAALMPEGWIQHDLKTGQLVELAVQGSDWPTWDWGVGALREQERTSHVQQFLQVLSES